MIMAWCHGWNNVLKVAMIVEFVEPGSNLIKPVSP
jgi:hypothetical protein